VYVSATSSKCNPCNAYKKALHYNCICITYQNILQFCLQMQQIRRFECNTLSSAFFPSSVLAWERPMLPVMQEP